MKAQVSDAQILAALEKVDGRRKQAEPAPADKVQVGGDHYKNFVIQPAEFITRNDIGFLEGCVIKRVCRYAEKNGREDLEKAIHELQLLMQYRYGS